MKILVTGGAGFIGSHLVDKLVKHNHRVIVVDNLSTGQKKFVNKKAKFYKLSITNPKLKEVFQREKPEFVYHLAAQKSVTYSVNRPLDDATTNIWGSFRVKENCLKFGVKKLVYMSTGGAIYGDVKYLPWNEKAPVMPESPYGLSKLTVDNYLQNHYGPRKGLNFVSFRPANIYGPRQDPHGEAGVVAIFISNLLNNKSCYIFGNGKQTRDYVYVDDLIDACYKALKKGQGIYNIGTGKETSVNMLYHLISGLISEQKPVYKPARPGEVIRSAVKSSRIKKDLNWQPKTDLIRGIKKTIEYFK
ncbi:MAG: UDP-glucose 4-epimerase [Candidatus Komeilibacteria bacterium CG10_big_fil_rev_8_21_14_0_10_41_13]|uniref:UDP-glucose 4-epimerase n=1 Tax=Candidatus Komeilibacteria bacterium CG10_big_fil_rev_8_21_14_0_10_41_13 TaxID=1974476 RepID=A0A2M6WDC0_9BACT|nr:MAG: UDP-glucose 4-epimerase [Candidatus Komeilibacteria bacterium CG10_big_fil_rev_8_21_14_0_10_41_13]